LEDEILKL